MEADKFYHVYNRTNNREILFKEESNYQYFLNQFKKYISSIADIYAYCLMPTHFHFVLRIKADSTLNDFFSDKILHFNNLQKNNSSIIPKLISQQFSNLFNSYTKSINLSYNRNGNLFTRNFKKKEIDTEIYLKNVIIYVHLNPCLHGFYDDFQNAKYSSYSSITSTKKTIVCRPEVIELFEDLENFKFVHQRRQFNEKLLQSIIDED